MPVGTPAAAKLCASWPAPLGMRVQERPSCAAAWATARMSGSASGVASFSKIVSTCRRGEKDVGPHAVQLDEGVEAQGEVLAGAEDEDRALVVQEELHEAADVRERQVLGRVALGGLAALAHAGQGRGHEEVQPVTDVLVGRPDAYSRTRTRS
ncbi:MAG: hypothetical protein ACE147_14880 [Candidatus Methylomirabilales bacterium]